MALFHMHIQAISRGAGRSVVAAAAYRSGSRIVSERDGLAHDFRRKSGVVHAEILLPRNAPERFSDRSTLWNEAEKVERSSKALLAREIEYALPREFSTAEQINFARAYARTFCDEGMCADVCVHAGRNGDNPHVHMLLTVRPCDASGFTGKSVNEYLMRNGDGEERYATATELKSLGEGWEKVFRYKDDRELTQSEAAALGLDPIKDRKSKSPVQQTRYLTDWHETSKATEWRQRLAEMQNERLSAIGSDARVDHRSYADRGISKVPSVHEGPTVQSAERKARARAKRTGRIYRPITARRLWNNFVRSLNEELFDLNRKIRKLKAMSQKLKRSYTAVRRTLTTTSTHKPQSANARKRAMRNQIKRRQSQHGGLHR